MYRISCFFLFFFSSLCAWADNNEKPDPGLIINPSNLTNYYDQLISPLIPLIKDRKIIIPLASAKDLDFSFSEDFKKKSEENLNVFFLENKYELQSKEGSSLHYGLPFGLAEQVNTEANPSIKAYKILWNLSFAQNLEQDSAYQLAINWFGSQALFKSARATYYRKTFPFSPKPNQNSENSPSSEESLQQLEILNFKSPEIINGYLEFSKRFFSKIEDRHWIFSTINKTLRPLPSSIRGDKILGCALSFDDLFNFSNKVQELDVKVMAEKTILIPISSLNTYPLEFLNAGSQEEANLSQKFTKEDLPKAKQAQNHEGKYLTIRGDKQSNNSSNYFVLFNHDSNQYLQLAPWAPVNLIFVPRKVWVLEIIPLDPFYAHGKEILYVDEETFLPFYKIVYNRIGEQIKTVISSWAKAETKDQKVSLFFNTFNLAIDSSKQTACSTVTESVQTFQGKENQKTKELLDLVNLDNYKKVK